MSFFASETDYIIEKLERDGCSMSEKEFFELEIEQFKNDEKRKRMIDGERYFCGEHDILKSERTAIGRDGKLKKVDNLPNNRIVDNQYQRMVNQKVDYLMGRDFVLDGDDESYIALLKKVLGGDFQRLLKCVMRDAVNMGLGWLCAYTDEENVLRFKRIPAYEILPYWKDGEHTELDRVVRIYQVEGYRGKTPFVEEMVEIYSPDKVEIYSLEDGRLTFKEEAVYYKSGRIPLVAFKYNEKEIPLITRVKSLQDALNRAESDFENNLQEDARNTILVLQNYDGTDLGEFRHNLALYGAVKVRSVDGAPGDIKTLNTSFDEKKYSAMITMLKSAIVENAMGYDAKNDNMGNNPNQLVIKSMFSDIDLDVSEVETEFKYSFGKLRELIDEYLLYFGYGYSEKRRAEIIFNRDCPVNESEAIENCIKSRELLSEKSVIIKHPWVSDAKIEIERRRDEND